MIFTYHDLTTQPVPERSAVGYLIGVEAELMIIDDALTILSKPAFPVLELALQLERWLSSGTFHDFVFESMDYEETGVVSIRSSADGWVVSSCFNPLVTSAPSDWETLSAALNDFIEGLRTALATIEPDAARLI